MALLAYLTLEGSVQGAMETSLEVSGFEKMIEVYAVDHTIEIPTDPNTGLATGTVLHRPFTVTKAKDETSPLLMQAVCTGETFSAWKLSFQQINKEGKQEEFYTIELEGAVCVAKRQYKHHQLDETFKQYKDMEDITFTYSKITEEHTIGGKSAEIDWKNPNV